MTKLKRGLLLSLLLTMPVIAGTTPYCNGTTTYICTGGCTKVWTTAEFDCCSSALDTGGGYAGGGYCCVYKCRAFDCRFGPIGCPITYDQDTTFYGM